MYVFWIFQPIRIFNRAPKERKYAFDCIPALKFFRDFNRPSISNSALVDINWRDDILENDPAK